MARAEFHPLKVRHVERLTADAVAVTFDVPSELAEAFSFRPGQSLTVRRHADRRSYSICSPIGAPPRIGVREVPGGAVSGWLVHAVRAGDVIDVQPPAGSFTPDLASAGHHVLIAAGSGITPVLSIAESVLRARDDTTVTLVYGNRRSDTVMFAEELADLKDAHPARLQLVHVLSREPRDVELFNGRLDADKLGVLLPVLVDPPSVDHWWLCGPFGMVTEAIGVLSALGVPDERIHRELFYVGDVPPEPAVHVDAPVGPGADVAITLDGRTTTVTVPNGTTILDAAQTTRVDVPFACKGGVCGTCRARLVNGDARMRHNYALEPHEVAAGYVLTCQSVVLGDRATIDFDC
jgi:ring-1,2-phenylacetyl-CoA epoxidase subunit PaaE